LTAQAKDMLLLDGRPHWLQSLPLQPYLDDRNIHLREFAEYESTGLWRGYRAVWEIVDNRLYLIGLLDCRDQPFDPSIVFGDRRLPIAAEWFSGRLEIGQGEALTYFHMNWGHSYSTVLRLYLEHGIVMARRRYDQTRRLRQQFDQFVASNPNWHDILVEEARSSLQPLGGLTAAGVKALGRPELQADGNLSTWPSGLTDEEWTEMATALLQHCRRVPASVSPAEIPTQQGLA
jgi:hypothetical protein